MSDEKPKPVEDLKLGLNLLFRAAKGAVESLPTSKLEEAVKDGAREVGRAVETVATEIDKVIGRATGTPPPPPAAPTESAEAGPAAPPPAEAPRYDDGYAPEPAQPPRGPRVE